MRKIYQKMNTLTFPARSHVWLAAFLTSALFLALPMAEAHAAFVALCTVYHNLSGGIASGVATLGVAAVGVGATLGKISSGLAVTVAVGIALMFGAAEIANMLGGSC